MDAGLVWDTWRRLLRDDDLVEWVLSPETRAGDPDGLTADELAILADYAATPAATAQNIGMYRRGLVRNALGALHLVPLTNRLLYLSGLDVDAVASQCARTFGYPDYGPNFWHAAADVVSYLAGLPEFAAASHQDVLALDAATIALARELADPTTGTWPDGGPRAADTDPAGEVTHYVASRAATVVSTGSDLSSWIVAPYDFDPDAELEAAPRHWLVYFPDAEAAHEYALLSERAARAFHLLREPRTVAELSEALGGLAEAEALSVVESLVALGVARGQAEPDSLEPERLPDEAYVLLDPAVEVLDVEIAGNRLLAHGYFDVGMVVPPGAGLLEFVTALRGEAGEPVNLGALRRRFDDQEIVDKMLASLCQHAFLYPTGPAREELADLRAAAARSRDRTLRHPVVVDLDSIGSTEELRGVLSGDGPAPEVLLLCRRLADHADKFAELARWRQAGAVHAHRIGTQTRELSGDHELCRSLLRLGSSVTLDGVPWPAPDGPVPGLAELTRERLAVHALMTPDLSITDAAVRGRALEWAGSVFLSGLCLRLEADALWPDGAAGEDDFAGVFAAVQALEDAFGDVQIVTLPSDEVLLGNTAPPDRTDLSDLASRYRTAYLRWRLPVLKACENDNSWSQTPEAEDKLVRSSEDLLPNNPQLLGLGPGSVVVDVCGGLGRVARRLAPAVGADGAVISFEMFRCISDRARRFANERGFTNVHFRPGLAQRIPLPDASADAAVNEWTGAIWELGMGPTLVDEMARVVRPGGRIAATHRLVQLRLGSLDRPWVQYEEIFGWMREGFAHPELDIVTERVWGQIVPSMVGENATRWRKQYMPRLINPFDLVYRYDETPDTCADVYLTIIAERRHPSGPAARGSEAGR